MSETSAALLREAFDRGFAEAPLERAAADQELLVIQVGEGVHALRVADLVALHADRLVTPLPSPWPELVGLTAFRGVLVPVYDLAALLGQPSASGAGRWVALARGTPPVAFVFESLRQHVRANLEAVAARSGGPAVLVLEARPVPILDLAALVARLRQRQSEGQGRSP